MAITVFPVNAVSGEPTYDAREVRQSLGALMFGATGSRRLGARSGVRAGTPADTVEATSTTWTVHPHSGIIDLQATAAPYLYAVRSDETGSVDAADGSNPRVDIITVRIDDPAEGDGSTAPAVVIGYKSGTAAASPAAPTPDTSREMVIAHINVPASGAGSPTATLVAPRAVAAGGIVPVRNEAERDALGASFGAVMVRRADADTGKEHEYTLDGTTWHAIDTRDTGQIDISSDFGGGGAREAHIRKANGRVTISVNVQRGSLATGDVFATLDPEFLPDHDIRDVAVSAANGGTVVQVRLDHTNGELVFFSAGLTSSSHYVGWTATWDAAA